MRKLLSLLTVMLSLFAGKTIAQVTIPESSTNENPKYYALKSYRSGNYMSVDENGVPNQSSTFTANCFWYFSGNTSSGMFTGQIGNYSYKDSETPYLFRNTNNAYSLTAEGLTWYVKANPYPADGPEGVVISSNINLGWNTCIDESSNTKLGVWNPSSNDWKGTTWIVSSVEDLYNEAMAEAKAVLNTKGQVGYPVDAAYEMLESTLNSFTTPNTPEDFLSFIQKRNEAIRVFNNSETNKIQNGYYRFICQNTSNNTYFATNSFGLFNNIPSNIIVRENDKNNPTLNSIWYLEATDENQTQFSFKNAATGEYLSNKGVSYENSTVFSTSNTPSNFKITYKYKIEDYGAGKIKISGDNITLFLNSNIDYPTNYWDGIGSVWTPIPISDEELNQYITDENISKLEAFYTSDKEIYGLNDYKPDLAQEEKATLESTKTYSEYTKYINAIKNTFGKIDENSYYYIISAYQPFKDQTERYIYTTTDDNIKWKKSAICDASMLWKFTYSPDANNPNGYNISSANLKANIITQGYNGTSFLSKNDNSITIEVSNATNAVPGSVLLRHYISGDKHTIALRGSLSGGNHDFASPTNTDDNLGITTVNLDDATHATQFLLVRAKTIALKTNKVTEGNWGTAYLPATIKLPEGAAAYYVSSTNSTNGNNEANLKKAEDGIIPAENGVLIYSDNADENGYITASIVYDNTTENFNKNLLQGSLTGTNVPENGYILTSKTSHGLGFYKINPDNSKIAGNKAYLIPQSGISQIQVFSFNFNGEDDTTTNIEDAGTNENASKVYYDLQGRRVLNPTKGIYITNDGKKVIFNK